jgi:phosphoglycolate phosphatase
MNSLPGTNYSNCGFCAKLAGMKFKGVIFDLDGTLVDTLGDIGSSMNRALRARGFPEHRMEEYREKIGWGITRLASLSLPEDKRNEKLAEELALEAARYYAGTPLGVSKPYPGIEGLIAELKRRKIKTAVLTNKPDPVAQLVIAGLFPSGSFDMVLGERKGSKRKPDPSSSWEILLELGLTPRDTIFMGDSEIDMETALAADCHALAVSWGYRPKELLLKAGAQRIIDKPEELLALIEDAYA